MGILSASEVETLIGESCPLEEGPIYDQREMPRADTPKLKDGCIVHLLQGP